VQNVQRWELETNQVFTPTSAAAAANGSSQQQQQHQQEPAAVLDRWILAAARSLTAFVRQEMEGYRLYTVVPQLVTFIDQLTNIYVRYNRKRLKVGSVHARGRGRGKYTAIFSGKSILPQPLVLVLNRLMTYGQTRQMRSAYP
jgi:isoleucyl-tRNA synthetase